MVSAHDNRMTHIDTLTREFSKARAELVSIATDLRDELEAAKRRHLKRLKRAVTDVAAAQSLLTHAIDAAPDLFDKPRSVVLHGIKVGLQKSQDTLDWTDAKRVAELVNEHLPDQRDVLIEVTYKPVVAALKQLDGETLTRIGVRHTPGKDSVLIKPVDGGVDKLVAALLKGVENETDEVTA